MASYSTVAPPPIGTPFLDSSGRITAPWVSWLGTITTGSATWANAGGSVAWGMITGALSAQADLSAALAGKQAALTLGNFTEALSAVLTITGGTAAVIGSGLSVQVKQASATQPGFLASADWTTFNSKQSALAVFGASGTTHAQGIVPDPGAVIGTTHFLREDATWAIPPSSGGSTITIKVNGTTLASPISVNGTPLA